MKEKDVISDYKVQKYILYAEKEDGTYGTVEGGSYIIENDLDDFWKKKTHLEKLLRERLLKQEITPVYYYMVLEEMTPAELGLRAGIKVRRVKQHLVPARFHRIRLGDLQKYSRVFNIPVANLFQIIVTQSGLNPTYHFYHEDEALRDSIAVKQHRTDNPWMVVTKAGENSK